MYPFCLSLIWVEEKRIDDIIPELYLLESYCFTFVLICAMFGTCACFALCSTRYGEACMVELKMKQLVRLQLSAPASSEIGEGNAALPLLLYFVFVSTSVYFVFRICVLCATRVRPICPCFSFLMAMTDRRRWGWMLDHCHEGVVLCSPWWSGSG